MMSELTAPPRPMVLTVGAGRLAALTLPRGWDEVVMLEADETGGEVTECGGILGRLDSGDSGGEAIDEGDCSGLPESSEGADMVEMDWTLCARLCLTVMCVWQTGQRGTRGERTGSWDSESSSANGHQLKHEASKKRLGCENRKPRQLQ